VLRPRGSVIWVAHASRVSALASPQRELSYICAKISEVEAFTKDCFGGTPKPARETRALPNLRHPAERRPRLMLIANLTDGAHEFAEIFAVARGVIERIEPRVHGRFG
jgi:hypothetical protein